MCVIIFTLMGNSLVAFWSKDFSFYLLSLWEDVDLYEEIIITLENYKHDDRS